ncbi:MAG: Uma2 family endonuclease [Lachnospiraceae bacterium]|nr:Uma2 family endonuclease [Lachnospiraceae bacterium]
MALPQEKTYTTKDIYALPDGQRAELIDGRMYMMAPPRRIHQELVSQFTKVIGQHIDAHHGVCKVYPAPFAVFLNADDRNYVEPDISVICDKDRLDDYGCSGAPDWIIEIVSPSTARLDYGIKLFKYRTAGVREYWIVNPLTRTANIYDLEHDRGTSQYSFGDNIPVCIFDNFSINIADLLS